MTVTVGVVIASTVILACFDAFRAQDVIEVLTAVAMRPFFYDGEHVTVEFVVAIT